MKVGDLVQLSAFGKKNSYYIHRNAKYGIVMSIEDDQMLMRDDSLKDIVSYRVRWFDNQGNPINIVRGHRRICLKFLNKKKRSNV